MEEQLQTIISLSVGALTAIGIYLTIVSGYLIVAYLVGSKLSRPQVIVISILFLLFSLYLALSAYNFIYATHRYSNSVNIPSYAASAWAMLAILVAGIIASLWFMWDTRQREK